MSTRAFRICIYTVPLSEDFDYKQEKIWVANNRKYLFCKTFQFFLIRKLQQQIPKRGRIFKKLEKVQKSFVLKVVVLQLFVLTNICFLITKVYQSLESSIYSASILQLCTVIIL